MTNLKDLFEEILSTDYTQIEENEASFYFKKDGSTLKILFECSSSLTDWKNNFDFPAKPYRDMSNKWYAHRGFLRVWKSCEPYLKESIMDPEINNILIGGYSHGAAIALLCHEYCKFNRPDVKVESYGFGCPRVVWLYCNIKVKKRFEGFTVVRNGKDLVTHVPPKWLLYKEVGTMLTIGKDAKYKKIEAHKPESYLAELEKYEEEKKNAENS